MTDEQPTPGPAATGRRRPSWVAALAALVTFASIFGLWTRQQADATAVAPASDPAGLVMQSRAKGTPLTATGRTMGLDQPCTAWLLDIQAGRGNGAYVVTTGRCAGLTDSVSVVRGEPVEGARVEFNAFAALTTAVPPDLVAARIAEVAWASRRGTDLAVLRLGMTYGELADQGVSPIKVGAPPAPGDEILVAGVPVDTIPAEQQYLRAAKCTVGQPADVIEQAWLWRDRLTSDCEGILLGSWGSPAFNPAGEAVAMVTTTSIGAEEGQPCDADRPCEVRDGRSALVRDTTYLAPVAGVASCFPQGTFTLGGACPLGDDAAGG
jgi:Trypsin-like peptidase domain